MLFIREWKLKLTTQTHSILAKVFIQSVDTSDLLLRLCFFLHLNTFLHLSRYKSISVISVLDNGVKMAFSRGSLFLLLFVINCISNCFLIKRNLTPILTLSTRVNTAWNVTSRKFVIHFFWLFYYQDTWCAHHWNWVSHWHKDLHHDSWT